MEPVLATLFSDYYGPHVIRYVGTMDIRKAFRESTVDEYFKWSKKYHPRYYFRTYCFYNEEVFEEYGTTSPLKWDVWVTVEEDNPDWKPIPGTRYYEMLQPRGKKKKYLPIAVTEKEVEKWVQNSQLVLVSK